MATNVLSVYDPYFYANEGLIALEASLVRQCDPDLQVLGRSS